MPPRVWMAAALKQRSRRTCSSSAGLVMHSATCWPMLPDSHASRAPRISQRLLCAQLERGHCVKWRGWPTAVHWPGRGWSCGNGERPGHRALTQSPNGSSVGDLRQGRRAHGALPPLSLPSLPSSVGLSASLRSASKLSINAVAKRGIALCLHQAPASKRADPAQQDRSRRRGTPRSHLHRA